MQGPDRLTGVTAKGAATYCTNASMRTGTCRRLALRGSVAFCITSLICTLLLSAHQHSALRTAASHSSDHTQPEASLFACSSAWKAIEIPEDARQDAVQTNVDLYSGAFDNGCQPLLIRNLFREFSAQPADSWLALRNDRHASAAGPYKGLSRTHYRKACSTVKVQPRQC